MLNQRAGLREYTDEYVKSPIVQDTMKKVKTVNSPEIAAMGTDKMRSIVEMELNTGIIIKKMAEDARGTPEKPLKEKDVYGKFMECASFHYEKEKSDIIFDSLKKIEKMDNIQELTDLLTL